MSIASDVSCTENGGVLCGDGSCVAGVSRCNQLVDCPDGADERGCSCADYLRARFMDRKLCDGVVDCWDFSDENNCGKSSQRCVRSVCGPCWNLVISCQTGALLDSTSAPTHGCVSTRVDCVTADGTALTGTTNVGVSVSRQRSTQERIALLPTINTVSLLIHNYWRGRVLTILCF